MSSIRKAIALDVQGTRIREDAFSVDWRIDDTVHLAVHIADPFDHVSDQDQWFNSMKDNVLRSSNREYRHFSNRQRHQMGFKVEQPRPAITIDFVFDARTFECVCPPTVSRSAVVLTHTLSFSDFREAILDNQHEHHEYALALGRVERGLFGRLMRYFHRLYADESPYIKCTNSIVRWTCERDAGYGQAVVHRYNNLVQTTLGSIVTEAGIPAVYLAQVAAPPHIRLESEKNDWARSAIDGTLKHPKQIRELLHAKLSRSFLTSRIYFVSHPEVFWAARSLNVITCTAPLRRLEDCANILQLSTYLRSGTTKIEQRTIDALVQCANNLRNIREEAKNDSTEWVPFFGT
jgi:hypothetical protein